MDNKNDIALLGLALGVLPRKVVQTKNGTESHIQEVVLINDRAADNIERLDEIVSQKSYLESSMFVKVCPPAKIKDIPVLLSEDNQTFTQAIRTSIDEEQILYIRATEKDAEGTIVKYDIVYMFDQVTELDEPLDPRSAANNSIESQSEHISRTNKGK
ncbi:Uncharacterized protein Fot_15596 [Forsythia ovata]|uniref:Uncharacterized protein n=1 Tax=Forsythia ovata TaxID=205694 RepID=A0ABD1WC94_9LAMI